ncbi:hypothetical protein B0H19DRAFT_1065971 [Mycena capillaripes]|nr:hypothetical protein B0H19DRAFT_1065971 [Mycena capillaripes]
MTHSRAFLLGLATLAIVQISTSSPLSHPISRGSSTPELVAPVKVLYKANTRPRSGMLCTETEKRAIEGAIKDLKSIAATAEAVLILDHAPQMEAVKTYLGTGAYTQINDIPFMFDLTDLVSKTELSGLVKLRYTNVREFYPDGLLPTVDAMSLTDYETLFLSCPKGDQSLKKTGCKDDKGNQNSFAVNINADPGDKIVNSIAFCPRFFLGISLADQTNSYRKFQAQARESDSFEGPTTPGVTLLHESQHALVALQSTDKKMILEDIENGVTPAQWEFRKANADSRSREVFKAITSGIWI